MGTDKNTNTKPNTLLAAAQSAYAIEAARAVNAQQEAMLAAAQAAHAIEAARAANAQQEATLAIAQSAYAVEVARVAHVQHEAMLAAAQSANMLNAMSAQQNALLAAAQSANIFRKPETKTIVSLPKKSDTIIHSAADLGQRITEARKGMKMSQQTFADLAGVGRRFVSELESGKSTLEFERVLKVCQAAGIDLIAVKR